MNPSGKRGFVFKISQGMVDCQVLLPCGQCIGCRLERSRQWAIRCLHEASLFSENCFITLTFNDLYFPENESVDVRDLQLFFKRLRKKFGKVRFFACGEYGDRGGRPHYHAILFGFDFADKVFEKKSFSKGGEHRLYQSESLSKLWPFGFALIGDVSFESAAYVARYVVKKVTGLEAMGGHYALMNVETGTTLGFRKPEFVCMSRNPGLASDWIFKFNKDVYGSNHDLIVVRGREMRPPKFYDLLLEKYDEKLWSKVLAGRKPGLKAGDRLNAMGREALVADNTDRRLADREEVALSKMSYLPRRFENG